MVKLSPRQELIRINRRVYKRNKRLIDESVIYQDASFQKYEKRYLNSVRKFNEKIDFEDMFRQIAKTDIVYVGDYHTLNQSQRSLLRILREWVKKDPNFILLLEVIQQRHQPILDKFMAGRLKDETFIKKIGFREHWFFDLWENYKPLFDFCRHHKIKVYGIEGATHQYRTLHQRDLAMAQFIADVHIKFQDKKLFVLVGDLHIAPKHLPEEVRKKTKKTRPSHLILYQNSEPIYWELAQDGALHNTSLVRIGENEICRMHSSPIMAQQSYLNWLTHEDPYLDVSHASSIFVEYIKRVALYLDIRLNKQVHEFEVFTCGDLSFLSRLRDTKFFTPAEMKEIKRQILDSESYIIEKAKFVYLADVSVNHAAEEAGRALRLLCYGEEEARPTVEAFYSNILHYALGFFSSKVINHRRKCLTPNECKKMVEYLELSNLVVDRILDYNVGKLFINHEKKAIEGRVFSKSKIEPLSVDLYVRLSKAIGHYLGDQLFYGLMRNRIGKGELRSLFCERYENPAALFMHLHTRVHGVRLPRRL